MNDRNLGRFTVTTALVKETPKEAAKVFSMLNLVVVRAESMFVDESIEYIGISDQFAAVEPGCKIPEYRIEISTENDEIVKVLAVMCR